MSRNKFSEWIKVLAAGHKAARSKVHSPELPRHVLRLELLEDRRLLSPAPVISLATKTDFTTGSLPRFAAIADINGDGKPDLIVANGSSNTVSVLLNTTAPGATAPSFAVQHTFATGNYPASVAIADLNGDGKPDIAVTNLHSNTVSVLLNTTAPGATAPSFAAQHTFPTGNYPASVAIADLNGDGKPDLVVANARSNTVSVLLNTTAPGAATPSFAAQHTFATGSGPLSVAIGDFNGDGKPDIAVTNLISNTVSVLLNTTSPGATTPSFAAQQTFTVGNPASVVIGDLNGDGKPDLVVANNSVSGTVSVLLNTTAPGTTTASFATQQTFSVGSHPAASVAIGDLDGDGKPDLVVANEGSNTVSVLLNTTAPGANTPSFAAQQTFATGSGPFSVAIGDLNGDGKPDLAVTNSYSNTVSVLLNTTPCVTAFGVSAKTDFAVDYDPVSVAIGDLNGDGKPDLVVANYNSVSVLFNTTTSGSTTPSFASSQDFSTGSDSISVAIADLNGDGKPDLVVANEGSNTVSVLLNTTAPGANTPSFAAQQTFATGSGPFSVAIGDLNGDGKPDLAVANLHSNTVSVLFNTTTPGSTTASFAAQQDLRHRQLSRLRGNCGPQRRWQAGLGRDELVIQHGVGIVEHHRARSHYAPVLRPSKPSSPAAIPARWRLADLNGDGKPDLVVANLSLSSNTVSVLLNTTAPGATTPSFAARQDFATGSGPASVAIADLNGDGKPDLAVANQGSNTISVLLNTTTPGSTTPSFTTGQDFAVGSVPYSVSIGDLNGDGKPDLVVANLRSDTVSVLLNTSSLTPTVSVADNGGIYNGSAFAATNASVTGIPPDGVIASFGDPSLSYTYYLGSTALTGAEGPRNLHRGGLLHHQQFQLR